MGTAKAAAAELGVIPSAVSHQLRRLEARLGSRLFERRGQRMALTEEGHRLLPGVSAGLETITEALADHDRERLTGPLRLSILESFALYWLLPRLRDYPFGEEGRALRLSTSQRVVLFDSENVDAAIRIGASAAADLAIDPLFDESFSLFARTDAAPGLPIFVSRHREAEWNAFRALSRNGAGTVVAVDSTAMAIKAATDGVGLGFAPGELMAAERAEGRVCQVEAANVPGQRGGYSLVYPRLGRRDRRLRLFREWLLDEVAQAAQASG